jgi:hypothetical protein
VLVTELGNHRVSQFALDGTFVGIFAGTGKKGSGDGEFDSPRVITVLGSSGEAAVADEGNHRVKIFDSEGKYKRQFGTEGKEEDGQFFNPSGLPSDAVSTRQPSRVAWTRPTGCRCSIPRASTSAPAATSDCMWIRRRALHGAQVARLQWRTAR